MHARTKMAYISSPALLLKKIHVDHQWDDPHYSFDLHVLKGLRMKKTVWILFVHPSSGSNVGCSYKTI